MKSRPYLLIVRYVVLSALCLLPVSKEGYGQVVIRNADDPISIGQDVRYLEDPSGRLSIADLEGRVFRPSKNAVPNFGLTKSTYWLRFSIENESDDSDLLLKINNPILTGVTLYTLRGGDTLLQRAGESLQKDERSIQTDVPVFDLPLPKGQTMHYILELRSAKNMSLPMYVGSRTGVYNNIILGRTIFGIYIGIVLIMFFYNFFIYLTTKDNDYLYYIFYILAVGLTQASLQGHTSEFFLHFGLPVVLQSTNILIALSGILSLLFVKSFLNVRTYFPRLNQVLTLFLLVYIVCIVISLSGVLVVGQMVIQANTFIAAFFVIVCGTLIQRRGSRSALYFNISWSFFVVSILIYLLKELNIIPYTYLTNNIILIGSSIEFSLLSFALADKINIYKKEKNIAQARALKAAQEKEQFMLKENSILEAKVAERTESLEKANVELTLAITNLKKAEGQLVQAEKMASIGQLTAGIAHEINNPINYIKSNVSALTLDINDLLMLIKEYDRINPDNVVKQQQQVRDFIAQIDLETVKAEIFELLSGIQEGAIKTADIVQELRTFSRLDEDTIKMVDIHEGIDTTLRLIKNIMPANLTVLRDYGNLPQIECAPGALNQVFMNILTNSVQAIQSPVGVGDRSHYIRITTRHEGDHIVICFEDSGAGISEEFINNIFDPFFTTKEVGKGTGLGLSVVYSIIKQHNGTVDVSSEVGEKTVFKITLPVRSV